MKVIRKVSQMQKIALKCLSQGKEIGLVPTMGALHNGHASLIKRAVKENDISIVSIFVNPIQFGPNEDYLKYPRPFKKDVALCKNNGVDYIFSPTVDEMFPSTHMTFVEVTKLQDILCGKFRKGHFRGVATVVSKLFNISLCNRAYFGMKDFQQLKIIEKMVKDLSFRTKIIPCPIIREESGMALSSRNSYLSTQEKTDALTISKVLKQAQKDVKKESFENVLQKTLREIKTIPNSKIDYVEILDHKDLSQITNKTKTAVLAVAIWVGKTRLIDNIMLKK